MDRKMKIALLTFYSLLLSLFAFNNTFDFDADYQFVKHVLSMDTTLHPDSARAIHSEFLQLLTYLLIIIWQYAAAILGWAGVFSAIKYAKKTYGIIAIFMGITLYFFGFLCIGSEWFLMWQSPQWNAQQTALMLTVLFSLLWVIFNSES